jgi:hypothetical protein
MIKNDKQIKGGQTEEVEIPLASVENARRKLMTKIAAGAFAVPTVLVSLSSTPAHAS